MNRLIKSRRLLAVLMAVALLVSVVSVAISASADDAYVITADSVTIDPGATQDVSVRITGNQGLAGYVLSVKYDTTVFEPAPTDEVAMEDFFVPGSLDFGSPIAKAEELDPDYSTFNVAAGTNKNITDDGVLFTFKLTAKEDARPGEYPIQIIVGEEALSDKDGNYINPTIVNGTATVTGVDPLKQVITFSVGNSEWNDPVKAGDQLTVPLYISDSVELGAFDVKLKYDNSLISIDPAVSDFVTENFDISNALADEEIAEPQTEGMGEIWISAQNTSDKTVDTDYGQEIATLTVTANQDMEFGTSIAIEFISAKAAGPGADATGYVYEVAMENGSVAVVEETNTQPSEEPTGPSGSEPTETTPSDNGTTPSGSDTNPSGTPTGSNAPGGDAPQTGVEDNALLFAIIGLLAAVTVGVTAFAAKKSRR